MLTKILKISLLLVLSVNSYAEGWRRFSPSPNSNNQTRFHTSQDTRPTSRDRFPQPRYNRYPVYNNYNRYPVYNNYNRSRHGISIGAATAIGLGVGVVGYEIGRSVTTRDKEVVYIYQDQTDQKIQCKAFDIKVLIDGVFVLGQITKCKTENGEWKIPDSDGQ